MPSELVDLEAPDFARDPFAYFAALRRSGGSVQFLAHHGFWIVLGHAEVEEAFRQPAIFSTKPYEPVDPVLLGAEPDRHAPMRPVVAKLFSAGAVRELLAFAETKAKALVQAEFDVVADFSFPLTCALGGELLGADEALLSEILAAEARSRGEKAHPVGTFLADLGGLVDRTRLFRELRSNRGIGLTEDEARSLTRLLWLAATTTTGHVVTECVLCLLRQPEVQARIRADRALLVPFIEEVLRLHPPEHLQPRRTTRATMLGGALIAEGADVRLCVSAANRDPVAFNEPDELRLERSNARHFTFGAGIHKCLGAALSRRIVAVAIETLLDRSTALCSLQPLEKIEYSQRSGIFTPRCVLIRLQHAPRS